MYLLRGGAVLLRLDVGGRRGMYGLCGFELLILQIEMTLLDLFWI